MRSGAYGEGYDADGNVLYRKNLMQADLGELYTYDAQGRNTSFKRGTLSTDNRSITPAAGEPNQTWSYAADGNRSAITQHNGSASVVTQPAYSNAARVGNQTVSTDFTQVIADTFGDGSTKSGLGFVYDPWARLVLMRRDVQSSLRDHYIEAYEQDALGRVLVTTTKHESGGGYDGTTVTTLSSHYGADGTLLDEVQGSAVSRYVWSPAMDGRLILRDRSGGVTDRTYALQDAQGNVTAIVDGAGKVQARYTYGAFGAVDVRDASWARMAVAAPPLGWTFLYRGWRADWNWAGAKVSGILPLFLYQTADGRMYDPKEGRALQPDRVAQAMAQNAYMMDQFQASLPWTWQAAKTARDVIHADYEYFAKGPEFGESLVPIWGSGRSAISNFLKGNWGWGIFYTALAVTDVFLVKSLVEGGIKVGAKLLGTALLKEAAEEGAVAGGKAAARMLGLPFMEVAIGPGGINCRLLAFHMAWRVGNQALHAGGTKPLLWLMNHPRLAMNMIRGGRANEVFGLQRVTAEGAADAFAEAESRGIILSVPVLCPSLALASEGHLVASCATSTLNAVSLAWLHIPPLLLTSSLRLLAYEFNHYGDQAVNEPLSPTAPYSASIPFGRRPVVRPWRVRSWQGGLGQ